MKSDKIQLNKSANHEECRPGARKLHNNRDIAEPFGTVKARDIAEPFGTGKARDMATGKELQKKVDQNLIKADKFGDEIYSSFVNEHIKVNLDIGLKKMKNIWKAALV